MPSNNQAPVVEPIQLAAWRRAAIRRTVEVYDGHWQDPENTDGVVVVKSGASDVDRAAALLQLVEEVFPEAAERIRARSKVAAKVVIAVVMVRLSEIALRDREFLAISRTEYAWRPKTKQRANGGENDEETRGQVAQARRRQQSSRKPNLRPVNGQVMKAAQKEATATRQRLDQPATTSRGKAAAKAPQGTSRKAASS